MEKIQKLFTLAEVKEVNEEERSLVGTASTEVLDRDKEIIKTDGWELDNFRKNPVILLSHEYRQPPIGKALWVKKDKNGLKFKAQFAKTQVAEEVFQLYKDGFMRAFSVGFIPKEWEEGNPEDEKGPRRIYTKQELLEISAVSVPSNPDALITAVNEGRIKTKVLKEALHIEDNKKEADNMQEKGVIPFKETPKAPEDEPWDAAREVREATVDDLKVMCTWYDSERPDVKQSYKLPHHKASGQHPVVWRGVAAAMAALFGARGGVDIPEKDRKGVYNHLVKHYRQFDKEPPEFREYTEEELKQIFPEVYEEGKEEKKDNEALLKSIEELKRELKELKEGRVLSEKNKKLIQDTILQMREAIQALDKLLKATEPPKEENVIDIEEGKEEKKTLDVDEKKLREIIATNLRQLVKEITSQQIDKLRGKVL
ncbi:MAG: HK97 family phage prohead protease, partial [Methermicoccaceae archaeon]